MIKYSSGLFGFQLLFRFHGSAVFKSLAPSIISSAIYFILYYTSSIKDDVLNGDPLFLHPYPMGALIAAMTFLLTFRANFSYNRYWEAMSAVHQMHSKWLDVGMELAAFHLQAAYGKETKPPAFGSLTDPTLLSLSRERQREEQVMTLEQLEDRLDEMFTRQNSSSNRSMQEVELSLRHRLMTSVFHRKKQGRSQTRLQQQQQTNNNKTKTTKPKKKTTTPPAAFGKSINAASDAIPSKKKQQKKQKNMNDKNNKGGGGGGVFSNFFPFSSSTTKQQQQQQQQQPIPTSIVSLKEEQKQIWKADEPPLFLEEAAHLLSLLSAVALSTLRNDLEGAESPLTTFRPNAPWPNVDPDAETADVRAEWTTSMQRRQHFQNEVVLLLKYMLNISRTPASRTLYNAARPFRVIGGISDAEVELLQAARGPSAKVALVFLWLQEFISREYRYGSTGAVAPPIISRLYQFSSDGMVGYNQARKIAYIPFPFPHAQITSLFVLVVVAFMPLLMLVFVNNEVFGFVLNFLTVMCFTGLHEVSRELENPFQNVPNDIPLNNFQAQFNEALLTMFAGYHPDAFWQVAVKEEEEEALEKVEEEGEEEEEEEKEEEQQNDDDNDDDDVVETIDEIGALEQEGKGEPLSETEAEIYDAVNANDDKGDAVKEDDSAVEKQEILAKQNSGENKLEDKQQDG